MIYDSIHWSHFDEWPSSVDIYLLSLLSNDGEEPYVNASLKQKVSPFDFDFFIKNLYYNRIHF